MEVFVFILFVSTAISLVQSTDPPINYDITTLLNNSIARTLKNLDSDMIQKLILNMENNKTTKYHTQVHYDFKPFQNEFYFTRVNITIRNLQSVHVRHRYTFPNPGVTIFLPKLSLKIKACLGATNDTIHVGFVRSVDFDNFSIEALKTSNNLSEEKLYIYIKYDDNLRSNNIFAPWFHSDIKLKTLKYLDQEIKEMLPKLFLNHLNHNEKFLQSLNTAFCHHPTKEITSRYPDFKHSSEQYHYSIPNITSLRRTISNITITGLWNFQTHRFSVHLDRIMTLLTIKNVRGYANLQYGSQNSTMFPLRFEAGFISVFVDGEMESVSVTAHNYSISQTNVNSTLTEHQSKWVMEGIELAIASSIMPSIKIHKDISKSRDRQHHPIGKISTKLSQHFQGNTIQKLYHDWNITMPESITAESTVQLGSFMYNISIWSPLSETFSNCYPSTIKCSLYNTLEISFAHSWYDNLLGKIRLSNSTHQFNDLDIVIKDILGRLIISNNSRNPEDFQFNADLHSDVEVKLIPPPREHNFTIDQLRVIFEKSKQMYTSWGLEMLKVLAKPLLYLPLDYCTTPVEIFDDFMPFIADQELAHHVSDNDRRFKTLFFMSKMANKVIKEWTKFPSFRISFYEDDKNLSSVVETKLETTKIQMIINDTSVQPDDFKWEIILPSVVLKNFTITGEIVVWPLGEFKMTFYDLQNEKLLSSKYKSDWVKEILECIISEPKNPITK